MTAELSDNTRMLSHIIAQEINSPVPTLRHG